MIANIANKIVIQAKNAAGLQLKYIPNKRFPDVPIIQPFLLS